jgi:hypothetical protein
VDTLAVPFTTEMSLKMEGTGVAVTSGQPPAFRMSHLLLAHTELEVSALPQHSVPAGAGNKSEGSPSIHE